MAICRFVNGFVDTAQRGQFAAPIHRLAEQLGIPLYMVEIRHDVTHGRLPSLSYLRLAAKDALRWLGVHYWGPQAMLLENLHGNRNASVSRLEALLSVYANARLRDVERVERTKLTPSDPAQRKRRSDDRKSASPSSVGPLSRKTAESMREVQQLLKQAESQACVSDALAVLTTALLGQLTSLRTSFAESLLCTTLLSPCYTAMEAFDERDPAFLWQPLLTRIHAYHVRLTECLCLHIGGAISAVVLTN